MLLLILLDDGMIEMVHKGHGKVANLSVTQATEKVKVRLKQART